MQPNRPLPVVAAIAALAFTLGVGSAYAVHDFPDVPTDHPFHEDISWLADTEITTGYLDGTFRPADPVSRGSMAAFLRRLAGADPAVDPVVDAATLDGATREELGTVVYTNSDLTYQALNDNGVATEILTLTLPAGTWTLDFSATVESDEQGVTVMCSTPGDGGVYTMVSVGVNGGYTRFDTLAGSGTYSANDEATVHFNCFKSASGPGETDITRARVLATRVDALVVAP